MEKSLDERSFLCLAPESFRPYFAQHRFPVTAIVRLAGDTLQMAASAELDLDVEELRRASFAIQLSANRRLPWSFGALVPLWMERFNLPPAGRDNRSPEVVLSAHFQLDAGGTTVYAGVSPTRDNLSPWSRGVCRIPRDESAVSRAEQKLREALELLPWALPGAGKRALDLGAAPGGWTRVLADHGFEVTSVDPAGLHPDVEALAGVHHQQTTSGDFLASDGTRYHLLVCDMKMEAPMAARLLRDCASRLHPDGSVVLTLKLPHGPEALGVVDSSLEEMRRAYTVVQARQLYFNRREVTVMARPRNC